MRLASPINRYPVFDAQFYFHFLEEQTDNQIQESLSMNEAEFTDAQWLTIPKALELCNQGKLPLFVP
jgi:hypothetical protein